MIREKSRLSDEEWRSVVGYEGFYEVSNNGCVRSIDRLVANGNGLRMTKGKLLKTRHNKEGYTEVRLYKDGRGHTKQVHRLVAEAFVPCPNVEYEVDHINRIRDDNRTENLRWLSKRDNVARVYSKPSENTRRNLARASEKEFQDAGHIARSVMVVRSDGEVFESVESAAKSIGYTRGTYVSNHLRGKIPHCKGYTFRYLDSDRPRHSRASQEVAQINCETGEVVQVYPRVGHACSTMKTTGIPNSLSGKNKTCCGYRWEYAGGCS